MTAPAARRSKGEAPKPRGRGTPGHRTDAQVVDSSTAALYREGDSPGTRIILSAAVDLMAEKGYHATTIRDIGERAGMSNTALYHHFPSKQDLLYDLIDRLVGLLLRETNRAVTWAALEPVDRLREIVRTYVLLHTRLPREANLAHYEMRSLERTYYRAATTRLQDYDNLVVEIVQNGVEQGVFAVDDARAVTRAIVNLCTSVCRWYRPDGPSTPEEIADEYAELALRLVGARLAG